MPTVQQLIVLGSKSFNSIEYNNGIQLLIKYLNGDINLNDKYPSEPEPDNPLDDFIDEFGEDGTKLSRINDIIGIVNNDFILHATQIAQDPEFAYWYVNRVGGRHPELESIISKDPEFAYYYADYILHRRWPEAEPMIMQNAYYANVYARFVIKGRWPEAEPTILQDPMIAYDYAVDVLNERWPEAEPIIRRSPTFWDYYKKSFNITE